jgi:CspA family cold shock protein
MQTGVVDWFDAKKGYGYIKLEDGRSAFVHFSSIVDKGYKLLSCGDKVEFDLYENPKGLEAKNVVKK